MKHDPDRYATHYWLHQNLKRKGRLLIGASTNLNSTLTGDIHKCPMGRKLGVTSTSKRLAAIFYWKGTENYITNYPELSKPLPIPTTSCTDLEINYTEELRRSFNNKF